MKIKAGLEAEYEHYKAINSGDSYSARIVSYGEEWANLMEARLAEGIPHIAKETSREADTDGITGFMYGAAVHALANFWEHGEELRIWHNTDYGQPAAKGTVNPAIMVIE